MKPQLPMEIQQRLPHELVFLVMSYVPHLTREEQGLGKTPHTTPKNPFTMSPNAERDLRVINSKILKGKLETYLLEMDDFVLD